MIEKLLGYIDTIKLSLAQFTCIALAASLGALIIAFKRQGTQLHEAQISILSQRLNYVDHDDKEMVEKAHQDLSDALKAYRNAP